MEQSLNKDNNDMNYNFSIAKKRKELVDRLKEKGENEEKIKKIINECDKDYKEKGIPYPEI